MIKNIISIGLFTIATIGLLGQFYYFDQQRLSIRKDNNQEIKILVRMDYILEKLNSVDGKIQKCLGDTSCQSDFLNSDIIALKEGIESLIQSIANEKDFASISSIPAFNLIAVGFNRYLKNANLELLYDSLRRDIPVIQSNAESFINTYQKIELEQRQDRKFNRLIILAVIILLYFSSLLINIIHKFSFDNDDHFTDNDFIQTLLSWNRDLIKQFITDNQFNDTQMRLSKKIIQEIDRQDNAQRQIDLYATLYNIIGYEIRDLTNKMRGGLSILTKDVDERGQLMARNMDLSIKTLEDLAENFNQLFAVGKIDHSNIVNINHLIADISAAISLKFLRHGGVMEAYFDKTVPPKIYGNHISLFWFLLLQLSSDITIHPGTNGVLMLRSYSGTMIDKITLCIDLIFTESMDHNLQTLSDLQWVQMDNGQVFNKHLTQYLLQDNLNLKIRRYQSKDLQKIQITFEVTPHSYPNYIPILNGKTILLCGDSPTQIDILATCLEGYGVKIDYAKTPNDILKNVSSGKKYSAILLTDTIKGIDLPSFCKTVFSRLQKLQSETKLCVSVAHPEVVSGIQDQVDHIFYRPAEPQSFINELSKILDTKKADIEKEQDVVLIVEDDELQQQIMSQILSGLDLKVVCKSSGQEALEYLKTATPMLIFMDCIMPGLDGMETTKNIRTYEAEKNIQHPIAIIGASALSGEDKRQDCINSGMDDMISKPYKPLQIEKIIKKYSASFHRETL